MGPKHGIVVAKANGNGVLKGSTEYDAVSATVTEYRCLREASNISLLKTS